MVYLDKKKKIKLYSQLRYTFATLAAVPHVPPSPSLGEGNKKSLQNFCRAHAAESLPLLLLAAVCSEPSDPVSAVFFFSPFAAAALLYDDE